MLARMLFVAWLTLSCLVASCGSQMHTGFEPTSQLHPYRFRVFNTAGTVTTAISTHNDTIRDMLIQSDGKIVTTGRNFNGTHNDFAIMRYLTNGDLDNTFSGDGIATFNFAEGEARAHAITIDSSGRYIIAGTRWGTFDYDFGVSRILSSGIADTSFGIEGHSRINFDVDDFAHSVVMDGSKIVVVGYSGTAGTFDVAVARLNSDGFLDTTFSGDGITANTIGAATDWDTGHSVIVDSTGRYVIAGKSRLQATGVERFMLARYHTDGTLDTGFDTDGFVETAIGSVEDVAWAITTDPQGRYVVAGTSNNTDFEIAIARYQTNGTLDNTFSGDGLQTTDIAGRTDIARGISVLSNGEIYVGGKTWNGTDWDFFAAKYRTDGAVNTRFGGANTGIRQIAVGSDDDEGLAVAYSPVQELFFVGGKVITGTDYDSAIARFNRNGAPGSGGLLDPNFDSDGITTVNFSGGNDESFDFDVNTNDRLTVYGRDGNTHITSRYNTNGALDTSFDTDGIAAVNIGGGVEVSMAGLLYADERSLGVGTTNRDFAAYRLLTAGAADTSFAGDGDVTIQIGASNQTDIAEDVALDSNDRIVMVGSADADNWGVVRLLSNGTADTNFSGDGILETDHGGSSDFAYGVAIQSDDKIIVVGGTGTDFGMARYQTNGNLDSTFSGDGLANFDIGTSTPDEARAVAIDSSGRYVVGGTSTNDFALIRVLTNGNLDTTFGTNGIVTTDLGSSSTDTAYDLVIDSSGRIILVGESDNDFGVVRYGVNGALDTDFGFGGIVTVDIGAGSGTADQARAVKIDNQDRIVVVGIGGSVDFAAIRFLP